MSDDEATRTIDRAERAQRAALDEARQAARLRGTPRADAALRAEGYARWLNRVATVLLLTAVAGIAATLLGRAW